jgi:aryl-alcohol dehydrogenase-like predicted oxidoreductase
MNYKILGRSGLRVSELSLGTMTFGTDWGWGSTKEEASLVFKNFSDEGGNFIDTANNYTNGTSESFIGDFIQGDRDRYVIATKFTLHNMAKKNDPNQGGNHRKNLIRSVNASLKRMNTDYIDLLYLHVWDFTTPIEEILNSLEYLINSGKVNYIGISDTPAWIVSRANTIAEQRGWNPFVVFQFPYNIIRRDPEREIMPMCRHLDIAMTTWAPLASGLLTGKYTRNDDKNEGRLSENKWGSPSSTNLDLAREVDKIADELGCTSAQVAINWVRSQNGVVIPIVGVTTVKQLTDNIAALEITLPEEAIMRLNDMTNFDIGFPGNFVHRDNVLNLIHGETYNLLDNHHQKS